MFTTMFLELLSLLGSLICFGLIWIVSLFLIAITIFFIKIIIDIFKIKKNKDADL